MALAFVGSGPPRQTQFLPAAEGAPTGEHALQGRGRRSDGARPPGGHVSIHETLDAVEIVPVRTNELLARPRAAAPANALEGRPLCEQAPEPARDAESGLDDELGALVLLVEDDFHGHDGHVHGLDEDDPTRSSARSTASWNRLSPMRSSIRRASSRRPSPAMANARSSRASGARSHPSSRAASASNPRSASAKRLAR